MLNNRRLRIITKDHIAKLHFAAHYWQRGSGHRVRCFGRLFEKFKDSLGRGCRRLQHIGNIRRLGNWLIELLHILDEGLNIANLNPPLNCQPATEHRHANIANIPHHIHHRIHQTREELRLPRAREKPLVNLPKGRQRPLLPTKGTHHLVTSIHLLNVAVKLA